ncbi:MAG TPA: HDOD domain-containing protein [Longimicrobiales bacterium]|nr:HDOD domain-containing protein [Longimicrobiales bacterium]
MNATELVSGHVRLSSPPLVYGRLMEVLSHPHASAADIARVIAEDAGLTGRLLRIVNSAFFAFPRPVGEVSLAVRVVGTTQIKDLALATSVMAMFDQIPRDSVDLDSFWRHSLACGVLARALAAKRGEHNIERYFAEGVMHDVGHLILYTHAPEEAREALVRSRVSGRPLHQCEADLLGFDHAKVGQALLRQWNLPEPFQEAVGYHHVPSRAGHCPLDAALVHMAEVAIHALRPGGTGEFRVPPFDPAAWELLGLDAEDFPAVVEDAELQFSAALSFMGMS